MSCPPSKNASGNRQYLCVHVSDDDGNLHVVRGVVTGLNMQTSTTFSSLNERPERGSLIPQSAYLIQVSPSSLTTGFWRRASCYPVLTRQPQLGCGIEEGYPHQLENFSCIYKRPPRSILAKRASSISQRPPVSLGASLRRSCTSFFLGIDASGLCMWSAGMHHSLGFSLSDWVLQLLRGPKAVDFA